MRSLNNSVEIVNAAATAIVTAEPRVQPTATRQKRRWGSFWSLYWCFGHQKNSTRIGHAVLVPEPVVAGTAALAAENQDPSPATAIVLPFIAPPSSPIPFLPSDPPSVTQSPTGLLSLTSLTVNSYSPRGHASIFAIGPYAYETQLVSPPVFSTFTTEPSTAPLTPPPESVQLTTPSSPEVPYAQLLTSSLECTQRGGGVNQKCVLSHYEFQPNQLYPGSTGGRLISSGSVVSNSGPSSPFPGKPHMINHRVGKTPKLVGLEHFSPWKWGSRVRSGSLTPDGAGIGSRLGSGTLTPDGIGTGSRMSSGCFTPDGLDPPSHDSFLLSENQNGAKAFFPGLGNGPKHDVTVIDHRISFELTGEDVARCLANKSASSSGTFSRFPLDTLGEGCAEKTRIYENPENYCDLSTEKTREGARGNVSGDGKKEPCYQKQRSFTLGSTKEFNFDSRSGGAFQKLGVSSEWWANGKVASKGLKAGNSWSFFPMLQPEI
ncbi:hypothetical protein SAY87_027164 [Trapa incisa]|uniref:Hydroxyproline-rich glycoprotein family protein n=1 Tax=Trapa incisa TaxID=236973 RepID=A0AAN7H0J1_9MYRT|nr:hypothetical protein SAY87_027164 [Trapa incisa]